MNGKHGTSPVVRSMTGDPSRIAPSVDPAWREDLVVELRLLSVPGRRIGDALATVEAHVADSGEDAAEAFGDARAYARELAQVGGAAARGRGVSPVTVLGTLLGLTGMLISLRAFTAWLAGGPVRVTTGEVVGLVVVVLLACALFVTGTLRLLVERRWLALGAPVLVMGSMVGLLLLLGEPLLQLPMPALAVAGVLLLVLSTLLAWVDQPADLDQVLPPGGEPTVSTPARVMAVGVFPLMTLLLVAFSLTLHLLTG